MKTNYFKIFIIIFLFSCNNDSYKIKNLNDYFRNCNQSKAILEEVQITDLMLGIPTQMVIIDTFLIIKDKYSKDEFSLIDLKNKKLITRFGKYGAGPNEIMVPININHRKNDNILEFKISNPNRLAQIHVNEFSEYSKNQDIKIDIFPLNFKDINLDYLIWFPEIEKYISGGAFPDSKYISFNSEFSNINYFGEYPDSEYKNNINNPLLSSAYQGKFITKPNGTKVAHLHFMCDLINIIKSDKTIKSFHTYNPEIKIINGQTATSRKTRYGYVDGACSDEYIYLLYSGRTFEEYATSAELAEHLYVFDWELNPIKYYKLPKPATSLTISNDRLKLYLTCLEESDIRLYKMKIIE